MQRESTPQNPVELGNDFKDLAQDPRNWVIRSANRAVYFEKTFNAYNERIRKKVGVDGLYLNKFIILNVVESYFLDIARLKAFHNMQIADRFKIGSYSTKWLMRLRPIQFNLPDSNYSPTQEKTLSLTNAQFSLMVAAAICKFDLGKMPKSWNQEILYSLHYRDLDAGILAQLYRLSSEVWPVAGASVAQR